MSGEIATPVIREMVCATCWPGMSLFPGAGAGDVSARAVSRDMPRQRTMKGARNLFTRTS